MDDTHFKTKYVCNKKLQLEHSIPRIFKILKAKQPGIKVIIINIISESQLQKK